MYSINLLLRSTVRTSVCTKMSSRYASRGFKPGRGTGDQGQSSLFSNERRWKDDEVFEALGSTDELGSALAVCREQVQLEGMFDVAELITKVQCCLQDLGSHIATPPSSSDKKLQRTEFDARLVTEVDGLIDDYSRDLPPLKMFILPGGGEAASRFHVARSLCRRAERRVTPLLRDEQIDPMALKYLNRLSDLLFVLARHACKVTKNEELSYKKPDSFDINQHWSKKTL